MSTKHRELKNKNLRNLIKDIESWLEENERVVGNLVKKHAEPEIIEMFTKKREDFKNQLFYLRNKYYSISRQSMFRDSMNGLNELLSKEKNEIQ